MIHKELNHHCFFNNSSFIIISLPCCRDAYYYRLLRDKHLLRVEVNVQQLVVPQGTVPGLHVFFFYYHSQITRSTWADNGASNRGVASWSGEINKEFGWIYWIQISLKYCYNYYKFVVGITLPCIRQSFLQAVLVFLHLLHLVLDSPKCLPPLQSWQKYRLYLSKSTDKKYKKYTFTH